MNAPVWFRLILVWLLRAVLLVLVSALYVVSIPLYLGVGSVREMVGWGVEFAESVRWIWGAPFRWLRTKAEQKLFDDYFKPKEGNGAQR